METMTRPSLRLSSTLTSKGQVTIPVEIRRYLRLAPQDRITFVIEGGQVRIVPAESVVARTAGALQSPRPSETAEQLRESAEESIAADVVERMRH